MNWSNFIFRSFFLVFALHSSLYSSEFTPPTHTLQDQLNKQLASRANSNTVDGQATIKEEIYRSQDSQGSKKRMATRQRSAVCEMLFSCLGSCVQKKDNQ